MPSLRALYLDGNLFNGPIPLELTYLTRLQELDLTNLQLTGPLPKELGMLRELRRLFLADNELTGPITGGIDRVARSGLA